jgi:hypothetical protein
MIESFALSSRTNLCGSFSNALSISPWEIEREFARLDHFTEADRSAKTSTRPILRCTLNVAIAANLSTLVEQQRRAPWLSHDGAALF